MSITTDQVTRIAGSTGNVVSPDGDKIGGIGQIYLDDSTGQPAWVTAKTGLFGTSESFVPLEGASVSGDDVQVAYAKDKVKGAPRIDDDGKLSPEEEETLYNYYGVGSTSGTNVDHTSDDRTTGTYGTDGTTGTTGTTGTRDTYAAQDSGADRGTVGRDTSGPETDDAMTLSEEQVNVGTRTEEAGRARLRKYVVTEQVTQTVPVSHEEVRIEREPITDANVGNATSGADISEEEHEVVLHAERPVVEKEAVPVERVRLDTETVTENVNVSEEVRKERLDVDGDTVDDGNTANRGNTVDDVDGNRGTNR